MSDKKQVIYDKYPRFLKNCHIAVDDGWLPVVEGLCEKIEQFYQKLPPEEQAEADKIGNYVGCQIKEKFGGLRYYLDGGTTEIYKWIDEAEEACWKICEYCGAEGKLRYGGWLKTLCDTCELHSKINRWRRAKNIDIQFLKDNHVRLYYFGLGFIQLKIDETYRLHFYSSELPPITEDIHNHRYGFQSRILKGSLTNYLYSIADGSDFIMTNESCNPDIEAPSEKRLCDAALAGKVTYEAGKQYYMDHGDFHRVEADNCVTLLVRTDYKKGFAQVVTPANKESVCPFSKQIPEERLWKIIEKMINED